jgi:hypothetical protein
VVGTAADAPGASASVAKSAVAIAIDIFLFFNIVKLSSEKVSNKQGA